MGFMGSQYRLFVPLAFSETCTSTGFLIAFLLYYIVNMIYPISYWMCGGESEGVIYKQNTASYSYNIDTTCYTTYYK